MAGKQLKGKYKYSIGEKVLCYEPEPTRAKVLYSSKVLDMKITKDENGHKFPEYLIHFLGWNNSWDRYVKEDLILPDTEENKELQERLAKETAAALYSKKKGSTLFAIRGTLPKQEKKKFATNDCLSSESAEENDSLEEKTAKNIEIDIPDELEDILDLNEDFVTRQNKIVFLPCKKSVVNILEDYVKYVAKKYLTPYLDKEIDTYYEDAEKEINFSKEIVDGIRVYFDVMLPFVLLYKQERKQLMAIKQSFLKDTSQEHKSNKSVMNLIEAKIEFSTSNNNSQSLYSSIENQTKLKTYARSPMLRNGKSLRVDEGSNLPLKKPRRSERNTKSNVEAQSNESKSENKESKRFHGRRSKSPATPSIQSLHKNSVANNGFEVSCHFKTFSLQSTISKKLPKMAEVLLSEVMKWKLEIDEQIWGNEFLPSHVYGAHHLLRCFVKLPMQLNKACLPEWKAELILNGVDDFLEYLVLKKDELFLLSEFVPNRF